MFDVLKKINLLLTVVVKAIFAAAVVLWMLGQPIQLKVGHETWSLSYGDATNQTFTKTELRLIEERRVDQKTIKILNICHEGGVPGALPTVSVEELDQLQDNPYGANLVLLKTWFVGSCIYFRVGSDRK